MVKDNGIPFEAKKPFETVQELKNEYKTPSFEEFMKTYEGPVNYADLASGDIGTQEGYGPCSPSYCSNCSCSRSDCNCRSGEGWTEMYVSCPAIGCGNKSLSYWVHSTDNYRMGISNQARVRCSKSYCSTYHMKNGSFACSTHRGDYRSVNRKSFNKALGIALQNEDCSQVIAELAEYIINHKSEWND